MHNLQGLKFGGALTKPASRFFFLDPDGEQGSTDTEVKDTPDKSVKPEPKFTQEDLDRHIKDRLARQEQTLTKKLLDDLGVETPEAAQAIIKAAKEAERANQSELEKLQADLKAALEAQEAANKQASEAQAQLIATQRDGALSKQVAEAGALNGETVLTLLRAKGEFLKEDNTPDNEGIKTAVEALKKEQAYLFGSPDGYKGFRSTKDKENPNPGDDKSKAALRRLEQSVFGR